MDILKAIHNKKLSFECGFSVFKSDMYCCLYKRNGPPDLPIYTSEDDIGIYVDVHDS